MNIYEMLDRVSVIECDEMNVALSAAHDHDNPDSAGGADHPHPAGWFAVINDDGIMAYFLRERDAFRFRLDRINAILNGD